VAVLSLFGAKIALSWRPAKRLLVGGGNRAVRKAGLVRVGVAVPFYNEDPAMLAACLESILGQSRPVQSVVLVDDCSADPAARLEAERWAERFTAAGIKFTVDTFSQNLGKRHGLMRALELQPDVDALLGIDSDTVLEKGAVRALVAAYARPGVTAVTGLVLALNYDRNLLTRLIDLRYSQSFLVDRSAQSRLGSLLCACGSLALYSASVLRKYRRDFLGQRFLGRPAVFGDDRRLTNYCLLEGKAVFTEKAVAYTAVPERMGHFLRQQVRWNKSFFRESLWVLRAMPVAKPAFWFTFLELASWVVFTGSLLFAFVVAPVLTSKLLLGPYLVYLALLAWARAYRYPDLAGVRCSRKDRLYGFLVAPVYGLLHIGLLVWLRFYSLATLRSGTWGTRSRVEVKLAPTAQAVSASAGA
jgi:hyaluronan synthase